MHNAIKAPSGSGTWVVQRLRARQARFCA